MQPARRIRVPWDLVWKEAVHELLLPCLQLLFPEVYLVIDRSEPPEFLDKELRSLLRGRRGKRGRHRVVDVLARLRLLDGTTQTILLHIEVQGSQEPGFTWRVHRYHAGLTFVHDEPIVTLVILADDQRDWRPRESRVVYAGGGLSHLVFPVAKLLDWEERWRELEENPNPFALFVMAHLRALRSRSTPRRRLAWKLELGHLLAERRWDERERVLLFQFLDAIMALPENLQERFEESIRTIEETTAMPFMCPTEIRAHARGLKQGLERGLEQGLERGLEQGLERGLEQGLERGLEQGLERGIEQGLEQGLERGRLASTRETVLQMLERRLGPVPDELRARVASASPEWCMELLASTYEAESYSELRLPD